MLSKLSRCFGVLSKSHPITEHSTPNLPRIILSKWHPPADPSATSVDVEDSEDSEDNQSDFEIDVWRQELDAY